MDKSKVFGHKYKIMDFGLRCLKTSVRKKLRFSIFFWT